ncbi:hypothetical protein DMH88_16210 [Escherichia coli]|nr:hypothetical protein [Escherichia coli]
MTAGIDSQRNRFEMYVWGWAPGEEAFWWIKSSLWGVLMRKRRCYVWMRRSNKIPPCRRNRNDYFPCLLGHRDRWRNRLSEVKTRCFPALPVKGASVYGKPVITMPKPAISGRVSV